jgi:hypothetical protein
MKIAFGNKPCAPVGDRGSGGHPRARGFPQCSHWIVQFSPAVREQDASTEVGADKAYDTKDFVAECRNLKVSPHVAQNLKRSGGNAIDERTTWHDEYAISQKKTQAH